MKWFYISTAILLLALGWIFFETLLKPLEETMPHPLGSQVPQSMEQSVLADSTKQAPSSRPETMLQGKIIDKDGNPLEKVTIEINDITYDGTSRQIHLSRSDGSFHIPWSENFAATLTFKCTGFRDAHQSVQAAHANMVVIMVPISQDPTQVLRVVNEAGQLIQQAKILRHPGLTLEAMHGEFHIKDFSTVEKLHISAKGFVSKSITQFHDFDNPHTIQLDRTWTLKASVTDRASGETLKRCKFLFEQSGQSPVMNVGKNGIFTIPDLHPQAQLQEIRAESHLSYFPDSLQAEALRLRHEVVHHFELTSDAYRITVVDPLGKPLPQAKVHFLTVQENTIQMAKSKIYLRARRRSVRKEKTPDLFGNEPKDHVSEPWYFPSSTWSALHTIQTDSHGIVAQKLPKRHSKIDLFIEFPEYQPHFVNRADLLLQEGGGHIRIQLENYASITVEVGQAHLPYRRHVLVTDGSSQEYEAILNPGETHCVFPNLESGRIYLELEGLDKIKAQSEGGDPLSHFQTEELESWDKIKALPEGDHPHFHFQTYGVIPDMKGINVKPGEQKSVKVGFENAYKLGGRLYWNTHPMPDEQLEINNPSDDQIVAVVDTDDKGHFVINALPQGIYNIRLGKDKSSYHRSIKNRVTVDLSKDRTDLILDFFSPGSVFGKVIDPPSDAYLELHFYQDEPWNDLEERSHELFRTRDHGPNPDPNVLISMPQDTYVQFDRIRIPLDPSGHFMFENIPSSTLFLTLGKEKPEETLVNGVEMPYTGQDLDLGELHAHRFGTLAISFQGGESFADQEISIGIYGKRHFFNLPETQKILTRPVGFPILVNVPPGLISVSTTPKEREESGFDIQSPMLVKTEAFKTTDVTLKLLPITHLKLDILNLPVEGAVSVEIRNMSTGNYFHLDEANDFYRLEKKANFSFYLQRDLPQPELTFSALRVPEGQYQFVIHIGQYQAMVSAYLERGKPLNLSLSGHDFETAQTRKPQLP